MAPQNKGNGGFSLPETLLAVGLIAILLALLFPVVQSGVNWTRNTGCVNNLRQMHKGFVLFINDNDGKIPPYREFYRNSETGATEQGEFWGARIKPYLAPSTTATVKYNRCPAEKELSANHYGMNSTISREELQVYERINAIPLPSTLFLLGDANGQSRIRVADFEGDSAFRHHGDKINLLFLDGHVEARRFPEIPIPANGFPKTTPAYKAFWRGTP